ncbi:hypothetical protein G7B40_030145 [Aetokthonos hydrillicola Thurmond2011]|uniref:Uncharacterized protein n=1 Tax=Aetokthonos hydrillicola Thurmond2011 TaxID=2712845 RepID=A0AAP5MD30_9CYAN|nr:hypothetical protein [Aetokthonos hydrillicola]MBO3459899.1 hypothetical protein [Aetokthonos hydrillicola CCALA 1050]MBW4584016.1 hypothetical protein [Aetokthonos hydrillicola CCALA 1050]MDR9898789.1 hypothetical protein [Aetokthonos hydrillicola Thurmond2011]
MSYSDFSFAEVLEKFDLKTEEKMGVFADFPEVEPSDFLKEAIKRYFPLLRASDNEKIRSEGLIFPVLSDLKFQVNPQVNLFSGIDFNVDTSLGLNGYCDYLITKSEESLIVKAPVIIVVEAKKENINAGLGQCLAEMVAAQIFNQQRGESIPSIYGTVTTGTNWVFLKLTEKTVLIDLDEYSIKTPNKIIGILASAINQD